MDNLRKDFFKNAYYTDSCKLCKNLRKGLFVSFNEN
jgi:hypothetical protein